MKNIQKGFILKCESCDKVAVVALQILVAGSRAKEGDVAFVLKNGQERIIKDGERIDCPHCKESLDDFFNPEAWEKKNA